MKTNVSIRVNKTDIKFCFKMKQKANEILNDIFSRFDGQLPVGGRNVNLIKYQCKNKSVCSKILTKLSCLKCYNRKSYKRKMEQKEYNTLNGAL